uniref:Kinesin motor domain-containing protein n=1 Tax=Phytophthora ramorum TaxID=164328 RepID=H3GYQ9_PHYRM
MALRDEHDFLSENERQFLANCLRQPPHVRADGRELLQQRKIRVQFRRSESESQAEVQLGRTRVIGNVHGEIVPPFPDRPTEGFLHFAVELSPMASPNFEASASAGRGAASSVAAAELARLVERGVRESRALDTEALAVVAGEKVWAITCHVHVVDHGGNLVDAASLAAIAALMHYRRPEVAVKEGSGGSGGVTVYSVDEHAAVPLSLHHIPISISFCFLQPALNMNSSGGNDDDMDADEDGEPIIFMDPTDREERITDARMSFTFNSFRELCAVHKIGGATISPATVLRCANVAAARAVELTTFFKEEEDKADKEAVQRRRALLRGRAFADVSSTVDEASAKSTVEKVDLGAMTDFSTLHAPISLRDDPTKEETVQQVTSMAELLESLETSADIAEKQPKPTTAGLEMTDAARDEFRQLANSDTVRDLIHGNKKQQLKTAPPAKKKPVADSDSDSEEEGGVLQSEFGTTAKPEEAVKTKPSAKPVKKAPAKKGRKKKAASSSDEDEDMDLSAAVKRNPLDKGDSVVIDGDQQTIGVVTDTTSGGGTSFRFDQVLSAAVDQAGVFRLVGSDVVDGALSGYNGCILAYGQTGAGKTFTMSGGGPRRRFEDRGLIARALTRVFQRTQQDADHSYALRVSYLEIYNDRLIDLLAPDVGSTGTDLAIQENARGQTFVRGLTKALVSSEEQALDLVFQGDTNRAVAEHALNASSTRSHCIFTLYLERKRSAMSSQLLEDDSPGVDSTGSPQSEDGVVYSKLHLVDLAGSERMKKTLTEVGSTRANEACYINRSLTFLEQVVLALGSKNRAHVPFRQTPLTNLLKDSLGGNCRTLLVACVWPASTHADQSLATLRFAARMRRVKTQAVVNIVALGSGAAGSKLASAERAAYRDEIRRLREELALYDAIAGRTRVQHEGKESSAQEESSRRQQIAAFLKDPELAPPIHSLRQAQRLLQTFRSVCLDLKYATEPGMNQTRKTGSKMVTQIRALRGHTPPGPSPSSAPSDSNNMSDDKRGTVLPLISKANQGPWRDLPERQERVASAPAPRETDKELYELFKSVGGADPGAEALRDLEQTKLNLREAKTQYATLALTVNRVKLEIDRYALRLQELRDGSATDQLKEGEDELERQSVPLLQLQDAKKRYRAAYEQLQEKKAEVGYLGKIKVQMLQQVALHFQAWKDRQEGPETVAGDWPS